MAITDGAGLPLAVTIASANPSETSLVDDTLRSRFLRRLPRRLIGDRGYDNDALDARLAKRGIEFIAPHRSTRRNLTQDGRQLRGYCRRWTIERRFAWLQNFRRLVTRNERHAENFLAFVQLGGIIILSRQFARRLLAQIHPVLRVPPRREPLVTNAGHRIRVALRLADDRRFASCGRYDRPSLCEVFRRTSRPIVLRWRQSRRAISVWVSNSQLNAAAQLRGV